jgi:FMN reductase (NADPH)
MELEKVLNIRKSVRSYTGEQITEAQLEKILKAAEEAPVGMARYDSIHLTIITNKELLQEIDANAAKFFGNPSRHPLYGAPALIVVSSNAQGNVASANVAMIIENMSLAAVDEGVGHCDIYGATNALSQNPELVKKLNLPDGFVPTGSLALGVTDETYEARTIPESRRYQTNRIE